MSIVYFSYGEGNSTMDLNRDTGKNRLMRMMIMIMMMRCDCYCSHSYLATKNIFCRDVKQILNHNFFGGIQVFFGQLV